MKQNKNAVVETKIKRLCVRSVLLWYQVQCECSYHRSCLMNQEVEHTLLCNMQYIRHPQRWSQLNIRIESLLQHSIVMSYSTVNKGTSYLDRLPSFFQQNEHCEVRSFHVMHSEDSSKPVHTLFEWPSYRSYHLNINMNEIDREDKWQAFHLTSVKNENFWNL